MNENNNNGIREKGAWHAIRGNINIEQQQKKSVKASAGRAQNNKKKTVQKNIRRKRI